MNAVVAFNAPARKAVAANGQVTGSSNAMQAILMVADRLLRGSIAGIAISLSGLGHLVRHHRPVRAG